MHIDLIATPSTQAETISFPLYITRENTRAHKTSKSKIFASLIEKAKKGPILGNGSDLFCF